MRKILNLLVIIAVIAAGSLFAKGEPVNIETIENLGMGGPGTTLWSRYGVLYNPALLGLRTGFHLNLFDLPISISNDIFKFYSFYNDNKDDLEEFTDLPIDKQVELLDEISDKITKYTVRVKIGALNPSISMGPIPAFGLPGDLIVGAGLYNQADVGAKMNAGILVPTVDIWAKVDVVLAFPVVYRPENLPFSLPGKANVGVSLKYIARSKLEEKRMSILEFQDYDIDTENLEPGRGIGWDVGVLYEFSDKWNFSFVMKDFLSTRISYSDDTSEVIKTQTSLGAAYKMNKMLSFAGEVRDIKFGDLGTSKLFTKLYLGGELSLIKIIKVRGGFYQGYPSFGFGLAGFLNYANYARELSDYPGLKPERSHVISLSIGF
ncbi:conjugal transfer protein TraF [Elusimicrobiota bacterium]